MRATLVEHLLAQQLQRRLQLAGSGSGPSAAGCRGLASPARCRPARASRRRRPAVLARRSARASRADRPRDAGRARAVRRSGLRRTNSTASPRSRSRLARCSAASSGASSGRPRTPRRSIRRPMNTSGSTAVELGAALAVQLDEALDAFARLGRDLRRLGGGGRARRPDRACAARHLDHAREVDLAQLDRRAGERAHDRGGVLRIDEQAHPGEHVAHLGALEERRRRAAPPWRARPRRGRDSRRPGHSPRIRGRMAEPGAGLRSWVDADRLGRSPADRRAGRRLAAARGRARARRSSRSRTSSPGA